MIYLFLIRQIAASLKEKCFSVTLKHSNKILFLFSTLSCDIDSDYISLFMHQQKNTFSLSHSVCFQLGALKQSSVHQRELCSKPAMCKKSEDMQGSSWLHGGQGPQWGFLPLISMAGEFSSGHRVRNAFLYLTTTYTNIYTHPRQNPVSLKISIFGSVVIALG